MGQGGVIKVCNNMQYWTSLSHPLISLIIISDCDHPQGRGRLHTEAGLSGDPAGLRGQCDALEEGPQGSHCRQHQGLVPTHCFLYSPTGLRNIAAVHL